MPRAPLPGPRATRSPRAGWRCAAQAALLAAALVVPQAAHPIGLQQLLRMPLEELLRLQISAPAPAVRGSAAIASAAPGASMARRP